MWLMMRGALATEVTCTHKTCFLLSMPPIISMIFEEGAHQAPVESDAALRTRMGQQLAGIEKLGAVTGVGNIHIHATMKRMSVADFQKTRNAAITYGVAGRD